MAGGLFGLGAGTPSRFPYADRPQPSPGVGPGASQVVRARQVIIRGSQGGLFVYDSSGNLLFEVTGLTSGYPTGAISWNGTLSFVALTGDKVVWNGNASSPNQQWTAGWVGGDLVFTQPPLLPNSVVAVPALTVQGATTTRGQLAFIKQTGTPNDHALTVFLNVGSAGGTSQAAANIVSDNPNFSTLEVTGTELNRGTIKVAHQGQSAGTDGSAAGLSIDLQTTVGGVTGTAAQGIFITSTTDTIPGGNAITIRYNAQDWFVVKGGNSGVGQGIVGIGVATGHIPSGMLEIAQKDTTTVGLSMTALAAGTDMISLKDSGGTLRWQVNNAGNMSVRANAFFSSPVIFGSLSSDSGGGGGGTVTFAHNTDPTTNPAAGHVILYCDASGNLLARTQAGNVRTVAAV